MNKDVLINIFIVVEGLTWFFISFIYPVITHVIHHELGHAREYEKFVNTKKYPATIHVKPKTHIPRICRIQAKLMNIEIRKDIDEWMNIKKGGKNKVRGMAEMPGKLPDKKAVKKVALGGLKSDFGSIFINITLNAFVFMMERALFVYVFHMPTDAPNIEKIFLISAAFIWSISEWCAFWASGKDEGDLFFYRHPEEWQKK